MKLFHKIAMFVFLILTIEEAIQFALSKDDISRASHKAGIAINLLVLYVNSKEA